MQCPRCQHAHPTKQKLCGECGTPLRPSNASGAPGASYAALQREVEHLAGALSEAHEQQTATAEILRVISSSPTDKQPVFDAIVRSARRLCDAAFSVVVLTETGQQALAAIDGVDSAGIVAMQETYPRPIARDTTSARAVLDRRIVHIEDSWLDPEYIHPLRDTIRLRSILTVPIFRDGLPVGALSVWRGEMRPFTDRQITLLQTFADLAVIAIENVRLFKELEARNLELTATSEILRVISSSPTDVQPVFDTIVKSAVRLCDSLFSGLFRFDGERLHPVAQHNYSPEALEILRRTFPMRPSRGLPVGRAILDCAVAHVPDVERDPEYRHMDFARAVGWRSALAVPLLREGSPIGAIFVARAEAGSFSDGQIALLQTFADQAVIAIENVRLFTELQASNRELAAALDERTATADVLRVIGSSPTDAQPVFEAIVSSARRLLDGFGGAVYRVSGDEIHLAAYISTNPSGDAALRNTFPRPLGVFSPRGEAIHRRAPVVLADIETAGWLPDDIRELIRKRGDRSGVWVPMMRGGTALGAIGVTRTEPGFTKEQIALLETFADQAVIAIENVRLFKELEGRNRDLTEALEQQTATAEILRVISSSQTDVQPVFDTIVRSAVRLCDGLFSALFRFDGDLIHRAAQHNYTPEALEELHRVFPARPTRALFSGRAILERAVGHIPDVEVDPEHQRRALRRAIGWRSGLFVPMLREGAPIGVIEVARSEPGPFSDEQIALLKTFADQAVIAVENVRLFTELEARNRDLAESLDQQTATSEILQVISGSPTDVQPTFESIAANARRLCEAAHAMVFRFDGELIHLAAHDNLGPERLAAINSVFPIPPGPGSVTARAILTRTLVHLRDRRDDSELTYAALSENFPNT